MAVAAVHGLAVTGRAVARAFVGRGYAVRVADDAPTGEHTRFAEGIGAAVHDVSAAGSIAAFLEGVDVLVPAPGVPPHSAVIVAAIAAGIPVRSEIDIAYEWEQSRAHGGRPILGVTGTDGKTTTTMIAAHLLRSAGLRAEEVGNTDIPFMAAVDDDSVDVFVVECSSFRLQFTDAFRCHAAVWLNFAPDHLDWHPDLDHYRSAKERVWAHARTTDVAVAPFADPSIVGAAGRSGARVVTFGLDHGEYRVDLDGEVIVLDRDDIEVRAASHEEFALAQEDGIAVALDTTLDDDRDAEILDFSPHGHAQSREPGARMVASARLVPPTTAPPAAEAPMALLHERIDRWVARIARKPGHAFAVMTIQTPAQTDPERTLARTRSTLRGADLVQPIGRGLAAAVLEGLLGS